LGKNSCYVDTQIIEHNIFLEGEDYDKLNASKIEDCVYVGEEVEKLAPDRSYFFEDFTIFKLKILNIKTLLY
jgi:hypothetical protein